MDFDVFIYKKNLVKRWQGKVHRASHMSFVRTPSPTHNSKSNFLPTSPMAGWLALVSTPPLSMEKLLKVSDSEVRINFALNSKCRCNLLLTSVCADSPVAFKIQTSSPRKFLVNPPSGIVGPSSQTTVQINLKPQTQVPPSFPRSHSDRFLIKTARFDDDSNESVSSWLSTRPTHDIKLKVAFVGTFLLQHAVAHGELDAVRNIVKRQKSVLYDLPSKEAQALLRVATHLADSEAMVNLLLDAGLRIDNTGEANNSNLSQVGGSEESDRTVLQAVAMIDLGECKLECRDGEGAAAPPVEFVRAAVGGGDGLSSSSSRVAGDDRRACSASDRIMEETMTTLELGKEMLMAARRGELEQLGMLVSSGASLNFSDQYGLTALHAAALKGHRNVVLMLLDFGFDVETKDHEGHTALHMAVVGGHLETVESLVRNGANVNARTMRGSTPLYLANTMGYDDVAAFLVKNGASPSLPSSLCSSSTSML